MSTQTPLRALTEEHGALLVDTWEGVNKKFPLVFMEIAGPFASVINELECPSQQFANLVG